MSLNDQYEADLYRRDATATVRSVGVRPQKSASRQAQPFGLTGAPIHGGGFPQWTEVRFRTTDQEETQVPDEQLTREPQALQCALHPARTLLLPRHSQLGRPLPLLRHGAPRR